MTDMTSEEFTQWLQPVINGTDALTPTGWTMLLAHDAAQRARIAAVEQERDDYYTSMNEAHAEAMRDKVALDTAQARVRELEEAAEMLWITLANVSLGDWSKQSPEWQEAAAQYRDLYFKALTPTERPPA